MFAYCENDPINRSDPSGESSKNTPLGRGWYYRIDPANTSTKTKTHIHVWNNNSSYAQNDDGSPHDKGSTKKGKLPNWVQEELIRVAGWDYNGNRKAFYDKTTYCCTDSYEEFIFADGTTVSKPYDLFSNLGASTSRLESVYANANSNAKSLSGGKVFVVPFPNAAIPTVSGGFAIGPIPLFS